MNDFWFEIVRRSFDRYEWVFVGLRDGRPRVLARSGRDYRSRKKARRAIAQVREAFPGAEVRRSFTLPRTRFQLVPGVLPLIVEDAPSGATPIIYGGTVTPRSPARTNGADAAAEAPREPEPAPEQEEPPKEDKPVATARRRKAT